MKPTIILALLATVSLLTAAAVAVNIDLAPGDSAFCADSVFVLDAARKRADCVTLTPTATATAPATATATSTSGGHNVPPTLSAPPTLTPAPTFTPTLTPPPAGSVPLCTHSLTEWHALYDATLNCHYNHEHGDDPRAPAAFTLFGTPGEWYGQPGRVTDVPWFAAGFTGPMENHQGYKWIVRTNIPCVPANQAVQNNGCITAYRGLVHVGATAGAAMMRFHSFSLEAVVEHDGVVGLVRHGGHLDTGHLSLKTNGGTNAVCPSLPTNPASFSCGNGTHRDHSSVNVPAPASDHFAGFATWYAEHRVSQAGIFFEEFGPINYQNPPQQMLAGNPWNGSRRRFDSVSVSLLRQWSEGLQDAQGRINWSGFTGLGGDPDSTSVGCTAVSATCIPLQITNGKWLAYNLLQNQGFGVEYDTSPAQVRCGNRPPSECSSTPSEWWITVPN